MNEHQERGRGSRRGLNVSFNSLAASEASRCNHQVGLKLAHVKGSCNVEPGRGTRPPARWVGVSQAHLDSGGPERDKPPPTSAALLLENYPQRQRLLRKR